MKKLNKKFVQELLNSEYKLCLSLYMPTHRSHPENLQDVIRYKKLVSVLEDSLSQKYASKEVKQYLEPFESLVENEEFWNHTLDGIAVFGAKDYFETVNLQMPVNELAIAADSFHTKPLRNYLQSVDHYHILGLSLHEIKLFEGNRHSLAEVDLHDDVAKNIEEALGDELTDKHTTVASYGGTGGESSNMHHGHGSKKDEVEIDAERFFRVVANDIFENYSKPQGCPLILAALSEHHNLFQKVNKNPALLENGIKINPLSVSIEKLKEMAWEIVEPNYHQKLNDLAEQFGQARANGKGSDEIKEVAVAAVEGRVDTLLVEENRIIPIRVTNLITGNTQNKDIDNPRVDDLLDDLGELVLKMGGNVIVMPQNKIPSKTGLAAIFRY
jgi:hypothetical protein